MPSLYCLQCGGDLYQDDVACNQCGLARSPAEQAEAMKRQAALPGEFLGLLGTSAALGLAATDLATGGIPKDLDL